MNSDYSNLSAVLLAYGTEDRAGPLLATLETGLRSNAVSVIDLPLWDLEDPETRGHFTRALGLVELASLVGLVPTPLPERFRDLAVPVLDALTSWHRRHDDRTLGSVFASFTRRVNLEHNLLLEENREATSQFLHYLDLTSSLEQRPVRELVEAIQLIPPDVEGPQFVRKLMLPLEQPCDAERQSIPSAIFGLCDLLELVAGLGTLIRDIGSQPVLASAMWTHVAWLHKESRGMREIIQWHATANAPGSHDVELKMDEEEQLETGQALQELLSPDQGLAFDEAVRSAVERFRPVLTRSPREIVNAATDFDAAGKTADALVLLTRVIESSQTGTRVRATAHSYRGEILEDLGRHDQARRDFAEYARLKGVTSAELGTAADAESKRAPHEGADRRHRPPTVSE